MERLPYSRIILSCIKRLEFHERSDGAMYTICPSNYECYGCNGNFGIPAGSPDPRNLVEVNKHHAMYDKQKEGMIYPDDYFYTREEIKILLEQYPIEDHYWLQDLWCDMDTLFIYKEVKPNERY